MNETAIKNVVLAWLRAQGCYAIKTHGDAMQERGVPDIVGVLPGGRGFALELKVPGQQPSRLQAHHLAQVAAAGGAAGCAHSLREAREWFDRETA